MGLKQQKYLAGFRETFLVEIHPFTALNNCLTGQTYDDVPGASWYQIWITWITCPPRRGDTCCGAVSAPGRSCLLHRHPAGPVTPVCSLSCALKSPHEASSWALKDSKSREISSSWEKNYLFHTPVIFFYFSPATHTHTHTHTHTQAMIIPKNSTALLFDVGI